MSDWQFYTDRAIKEGRNYIVKRKHLHTWKQTTRIMKRTMDSNWIERLFYPYYNATISECKCGEWYFRI